LSTSPERYRVILIGMVSPSVKASVSMEKMQIASQLMKGILDD
jgi:hypothetical protein